MITKNSRVRYIDTAKDKIYGIMAVLEIKNGYATCCYGGYHNTSVVTLPLSEIKLA